MRKRLLCGLILIFGTGANAQWLNYPTPGTPRTKDGKPNLSAPAPRTPDGKPDTWSARLLTFFATSIGDWGYRQPACGRSATVDGYRFDQRMAALIIESSSFATVARLRRNAAERRALEFHDVLHAERDGGRVHTRREAAV